MTQWVPPPWPELLCANERTKAILSAICATFGKTPPISTPGRFVFTAPTTLRYSDGADILGSKVSTWVGPPPSQSQTTEVFRLGLPMAAALARARSRSGSRKPPMPRAPTLRKSRRLPPSQLVPLRDPYTLNMACSSQRARASWLREAGMKAGAGRQRVAGSPPTHQQNHPPAEAHA